MLALGHAWSLETRATWTGTSRRGASEQCNFGVTLNSPLITSK